MRNDIDPGSIVRLHLIGRVEWQHKTGAMIQAGDYDGYRALTASGERRTFLALHPNDDSTDWLDITNDLHRFMAFNRDDIGSRLAHKLGLSQSPGKDVMKKFAARTRTLQQEQQGTLDQMAMMAAREIFPAEFQPTRYAGANLAIEPLLIEIEKL
jgi:hypothetical protein